MPRQIPGRPPASPARTDTDGRRLLLEHLRCIALHSETAAALELRAVRSTNPTLATVLRDRAERHRLAADRLWEELRSRELPGEPGPRGRS